MKEHDNMTLQEIFNTVVMNDEQLIIPFADRRSYDSLRVALVRKFSTYRKQCQSVGVTSYDDRFVSCSVVCDADAGTTAGTFGLKWREDSKRVRKEYAAFKL
jgi:hypothetical protein